MVPLGVVVRDELTDGPPQMRFSQGHHPVRAFAEVPWHVPTNGPAEIGNFLAAFTEKVSIEVFEPRQFIASGNEVVNLHLAYTIKKTGIRVDEEQLQWWSLADGRVTRLRHFEDAAQVIGAWHPPR